MELTKHVHACVTLDDGAAHLVIDPGTYTPNASELIAATETVLITHEHVDHFDEDAIAAALEDRPELTVYGPGAVVGRWRARTGQIVDVADGDSFIASGFEIAVHGALHARIHRDIPQVANVGYLVNGALYHPGDAYHVPRGSVTTLLLPTSGPWTSVGEAADFVRADAPRRALQIHEIMLSEVGQRSMQRFLGPEMLTTVPLEIVPPGDTVTV